MTAYTHAVIRHILSSLFLKPTTLPVLPGIVLAILVFLASPTSTESQLTPSGFFRLVTIALHLSTFLLSSFVKSSMRLSGLPEAIGVRPCYPMAWSVKLGYMFSISSTHSTAEKPIRLRPSLFPIHYCTNRRTRNSSGASVRAII